MSIEIITSILVGFFGFVLVLLLSVLGFFIIRWIKGWDKSMELLNQSLEKLSSAVTKLDGKVDQMDSAIAAHDKMIEHIQNKGCGHPECPMWQGRPV
jgi:uncharacterized protein YoxC